MNRLPETEAEALHAFAEDLRRDKLPLAAAVVDAGQRFLAGAVAQEIGLHTPADRVGFAMAVAWGQRRDAAILAAYRSLHARETDGDEDVALAAMAAAGPSAPAGLDVAALLRNELAHHARTLVPGGRCAARAIERARSAEDWSDALDGLAAVSLCREGEPKVELLRLAVVAMRDGDEGSAVAWAAALANVSPEVWLSSTTTMHTDPEVWAPASVATGAP